MVDQTGNEIRYEINGGVIEVKMNKIILLAESVRENK
jgi:F0F1-type ATP synthase epsilon subunit